MVLPVPVAPVAKMMESESMNIPLLIGGATTSKVHTAVKIEPEYSGVTSHVLDASKSVPVASGLLSEKKDDYSQAIKNENQKTREQNAKRRGKKVFAVKGRIEPDPIGSHRRDEVSKRIMRVPLGRRGRWIRQLILVKVENCRQLLQIRSNKTSLRDWATRCVLGEVEVEHRG